MHDAEVVGRPGTFALVPLGVPHALRRVTEDPVRMITLVSPPGFEHFFDAVVNAGEEAFLADPDRLLKLAAAFGTDVLGPHPLAD